MLKPPLEFVGKSCAITALIVSLLLTMSQPSRAATPHPFHISMAEVEYNAESEVLEVAFKVHAADLEQSLTLRAGQKVDIDQEEIGAAVEAFIDEYFYFLPADMAQKIDTQSQSEDGDSVADFPRSTCKFVGKEFETTWVWLYFELELPDTEEPLAVVDAVFLDRIEKQINTVTFRLEAQKQAIKLTRKNPWAPVPWLDELLTRAEDPPIQVRADSDAELEAGSN